MKKFVATTILLLFLTGSFADSVGARDAVHIPKNHANCIDASGKWIDSKECTQQQTGCGCLFHQIADFLMEMFD